MASITKLNGKWRVRVSWYDDQGQRHFKTKAGFSTKIEANQWARAIEVQKNDGSISDKNISLADYYKEWFQTYKENKVSDVTANRYKIIYRELVKHFGNTKLEKINRRRYQLFINEFGSTHAPDTVKKTNSIIRACVKSAIIDNLISKDFTQNIELIWNEDKVRKVDYLNVSELQQLTQYIRDHLDSRYTSYYMIYTAIMTGARLQEIAGLTWDDINLNFKTIDINKAWDFHNKKFSPTKNKSSVRIIRINSDLVEVLKQLKVNHNRMVFANSLDKIPTSNGCNKSLRYALKQLNINKPSYHFHALRHSHVALLLYKNIDIFAISKRLGHADLNTTTRVYAYLIDELKQRSDQDIENVLNDLSYENNTTHYKANVE